MDGFPYTKNGKTYMVNYYSTSSEYSAPEVFLKTTFHGHTAFKNSEDPDDMYVIESDGSLGGYYMGDRASTFPKVN
ncbi:MAG: hypothetical protein MJZ16_02825 [Bacteroidales bacterium]|nr:hypothetical protein [Bacteroidales bacterium]